MVECNYFELVRGGVAERAVAPGRVVEVLDQQRAITFGAPSPYGLSTGSVIFGRLSHFVHESRRATRRDTLIATVAKSAVSTVIKRIEAPSAKEPVLLKRTRS